MPLFHDRLTFPEPLASQGSLCRSLLCALRPCWRGGLETRTDTGARPAPGGHHTTSRSPRTSRCTSTVATPQPQPQPQRLCTSEQT